MKPADLVAFARARWQEDGAGPGIEDAYKWLFHATQGGEHAVTSPDGPRAWLDREWETLGAPRESEPLVEPLRRDGRVVRLHLRPFRARGGDKAALLAAFVASARSFRADRAAFAAAWDALGSSLKQAPAPPHLTPAEWRRLDAATRTRGFPALHHGARYEKAARPAYRVLTGEEARRLTKALSGS